VPCTTRATFLAPISIMLQMPIWKSIRWCS
jgi:hypothetical protein